MNKFLLIFLLILLVPSVAATQADTTEYLTTGADDDNSYRQLFTDFHELKADATLTANIPVSDTKLHPYSSDLDGDGTIEIVMVGGATIRVFQNTTLSLISSFALGTPQRVSNLEIFDIDGDSNKELIIVAEEDGLLFITEFNGTDINLEKIHNLTIDSYLGATAIPGCVSGAYGEAIIKCRATESCLIVQSLSGHAESGRSCLITDKDNITAKRFTSTTLSDGTKVSTAALGGTDTFCFPSIKNIALADFKTGPTDPGEEYAFTFMEFNPQVTNEVISLAILDDDNPPNLLDLKEDSAIGIFGIDSYGSTAVVDCTEIQDSQFKPQLFTSPTSVNLGGTNQLIVGLMQSSGTDIDMIRYETEPLSIAEHYQDSDSEGESISNIVLNQVFIPDEGTDFQDFCVAGFDDTNNNIAFFCAGEGSGVSDEVFDFPFSIPTPNNAYDYRYMIHEAIADDVFADVFGPVTSEEIFITQFGIFRTTDIPSFNQVFTTSLFDSGGNACVAIDSENNLKQDLVCNTNESIFYLDDAFVNEGGFISNVEFNPCPLGGDPIKVNQSIQVIVTGSDPNNDKLNMNVTLYRNTDNEITQTASLVPTNFQQPFTFNLNATDISTSIRVIIADTENPTELSIQDFGLSVQDNGLEFGDSSCDLTFDDEGVQTEGFGIVPDVEILPDGTNASDNFATNALTVFTDTTGLGSTTGWILLMIIVSVIILTSDTFFQNKDKDPIWVITGLIIVNILMLILGVLLQAISFGVLLALVIVGAVGIGFFVKKVMMGQTT